MYNEKKKVLNLLFLKQVVPFFVICGSNHFGKVQVNDIVYLYTTAPVQRIEYKMVVDRINVPFDEIIDDSAYQLHRNPRSVPNKDALYVRLKLINKVDTPLLHLNFLRGYGLRSSMQSALTVSGDLLEYIEAKFQ